MICVLIQIGGIGIMVLSAAFVILAGQRLRVKSSAVIAQMVDATSLASMRQTVLTIIAFTLLIEAAGAGLFYLRFESYPELATRAGGDLAGPGNLWWAAIFHAVSGFCGAGMSNAYGGLVPLVGDQVENLSDRRTDDDLPSDVRHRPTPVRAATSWRVPDRDSGDPP